MKNMVLFYYFEDFLKLQEGSEIWKKDKKKVLEKTNRLFRKTYFVPIKPIQMFKLQQKQQEHS